MKKLFWALLPAFAAQGSLAAYTAEVKMTKLHFDVVDLRPDDGLSAGAIILDRPHLDRAWGELAGRWANQRFSFYYYENNFKPFEWDFQYKVTPAKYGSVWTQDGLDMSMSASTHSVRNVMGKFDMYLSKRFFVGLAPHTSTLWEADYEMSVAVDRAPGAHPLGFGSARFNDLEIMASVDGLRGPASDHMSGLFQYVLSNPSGDYVQMPLEINMHIYGQSPVARPMPEPQSYALMIFGAGVLGVWTRKRRQPSAATADDEMHPA